jgi:two-component system sensor histidine kinase QseC
VNVELNPTLLTEFAAGGRNAFVIRDTTGTNLIEWSANQGLRASSGAKSGETTWSTDVGPTGSPVFMATAILPAQWGWDLDDTSIDVAEEVRLTEVQITVAHDRSALDATLRDWALVGVFMTIVATMAAGAAVWLSTARALRPLDALADRAKQINEPAEFEPFDTNGPSELTPIARRLNNLLARLYDASLGERRFTADAAHELRTPIAELRTLTDVALAFPDDPARLESVARISNELSIRLTSLVDALLGIARRETVKSDLRSDPVDILALLQHIIAGNRTTISNCGLTVEFDGPDTHILDTDTALSTSVMTNLIGNAVSYAPQGTGIKVNYSGGSNGFRLDIINRAPDLSQADLDMVFEQFWRKQGPHADRSHSGLGSRCRKTLQSFWALRLMPIYWRRGIFN